jgi:hypothetical protein
MQNCLKEHASSAKESERGGISFAHFRFAQSRLAVDVAGFQSILEIA